MWQPLEGDLNERLSIKDEPFEELFVPESSFHLTNEHTGNENSFKSCCLCREGSSIQQKLFEHIQAYHTHDALLMQNPIGGLRCCFCEEGLLIQTELINHLLSHFSVKCEADRNSLVLEPAAIKPCEQTYTEKRNEGNFDDIQQLGSGNEKDPAADFTENRRTRNDSLAPKIKCNFCSKTFKYKQGVQKHYDLEHNPSNTFPCTRPDCTSRCKTLKNLHAHLRTHDPPREDVADLQCHKCLKIFPTQKQLTLHLYTHREKFFSCDLCGLKFNNREQTKNHVLRHAGLFQKKFTAQRIICDECSSLVLSHKMKRHKMIHHSHEKPFKCDFAGCCAAFSDNRVLQDHKNIHLKIKPYKCEYCSESFRSGANLRLHRVRHTDPDRHRCEECQTSFVTKQALQKHNRKHTDDPDIRPFACDFPGCSSTFKQKDHVRNHIRRNHEKTDEVFPCTIENCTKVYDRKDALGKHLRKTHNICKRKPRVFPAEEISFLQN